MKKLLILKFSLYFFRWNLIEVPIKSPIYSWQIIFESVKGSGQNGNMGTQIEIITF